MVDKETYTSKKTIPFFSCDFCAFTTSKKQNYKTHLTTAKHQMLTHTDRMLTNTDRMLTQKDTFKCDCGKEYKYRQSLHVHKKKCNMSNSMIIESYPVNSLQSTELDEKTPENELVSVLLHQNNMFQELILKSEEEKKELIRKTDEEKKELIRKTDERDTQMIELHQQFLEALKNGSLGHTTNNHNTQNNQFNLQLYLNETCKDAVNLDEFLKSIKLTTQDYVDTGEVGFIEGLTNIFRKELHKLEPHHRPLQCTDVKREVIYVKENDEWTKDIENKKSLNIVKRIDLSYQNMMYKWMEENPGYRAEEGPLVEDGIKYSVVCFGRNRLDGNEPIFRGKILKNVLDDLSIKRGSKVITVK